MTEFATLTLKNGIQTKVSISDVARIGKSNLMAIKARRKVVYIAISIGGMRYIRLHRFLLNAKEGELVDHVNGDTLDNRQENLRICTAHQNAINRRADIQNQSGYKGVYKRNGKYCATIGFNGKHYHLGTFLTPEGAAVIYNREAERYFGEYARLNIIRDIDV